MLRHKAIAILTYHSLDKSGSVLSIAPDLFARQMQALADASIQVVSLDRVRDTLRQGTVIEPLVAITFDDGFQNIRKYGLPILERHGFPATVFLVAEYCERDNGWPSQPPVVRRRSLLRWSEVKEMCAARITFGSHTLTHPDLTDLPRASAAEEIISSKKRIEDTIGRSVEFFAYPYGAYNEQVKTLVKQHYSLACSTELGFVKASSDLLALERLDVYYLRRSVLFRRLFSNELDVYLRLRRTLRQMRSEGLKHATVV